MDKERNLQGMIDILLKIIEIIEIETTETINIIQTIEITEIRGERMKTMIDIKEETIEIK